MSVLSSTVSTYAEVETSWACRLREGERNVLSVVIPAYNEEDGIAEIIERVLAVRENLTEVGVDDLELIVVDDGSCDRTAEIAAEYPGVHLICQRVNRGYGAALKTGFSQARGNLLRVVIGKGLSEVLGDDELILPAAYDAHAHVRRFGVHDVLAVAGTVHETLVRGKQIAVPREVLRVASHLDSAAPHARVQVAALGRNMGEEVVCEHVLAVAAGHIRKAGIVRQRAQPGPPA